MTSGSNPELLIDLDHGPGGRRARLEAELRAAVREGRIGAGSALPPSRALAADLGISRRLVADAYAQLQAEGYLHARRGAGTWVARGAARPAAPAAEDPLVPPPARFDFFGGAPDLASFPRAAWARATREAIREAPDALLGYPDPRGVAELRAELAAYLGRTRAVVAAPEGIVVCGGAAQALGVLARALIVGGRGRIAVEDPSLGPLRGVLAAAGAELVPVPVDEDGLDVAALARTAAEVVLVTPAHQNPMGVALAPERRAALLAWAAEGDRLVIEDDYNAEFRYDGRAVAALHGLAPERVAYVGSASKALAPALRLAWIAVPAGLRREVTAQKLLADFGTPALEQLAFARFLARGDLDRHLRAGRRRYRARRAALGAALERHLPGAELLGQDAGLFARVRLPGGERDARALVAAARARDVGVYPLSWFAVEPPERTDALVLGYGNLTEPAIAEGVRRLAEALERPR